MLAFNLIFPFVDALVSCLFSPYFLTGGVTGNFFLKLS